jgi:hypothetical protein
MTGVELNGSLAQASVESIKVAMIVGHWDVEGMGVCDSCLACLSHFPLLSI